MYEAATSTVTVTTAKLWNGNSGIPPPVLDEVVDVTEDDVAV
jgi:hypothetical protein